MNLVIDREATAGEQVEFSQALQSTPELQLRYSELQALADDLDSFQAIEPPAGFRSLVMIRIRENASERLRPISGAGRFGVHSRRRTLTAVWATAAAIVLCVALYPTLRYRPSVTVGTAQASGAIGSVDSGSWPVISRAVREGSEPVVLTVRRSGDRIAVQVESTGGSHDALAVHWNPEVFSFLASGGAVGDTDRINQSGTALVQAGEVQTLYLLRKAAGDGSGLITVSRKGAVILKASIH